MNDRDRVETMESQEETTKEEDEWENIKKVNDASCKRQGQKVKDDGMNDSRKKQRGDSKENENEGKET